MGCAEVNEEAGRNDEGAIVVSTFVRALQNDNFSEAYQYFHPEVKENWKRRGAILLNFDEHVDRSEIEFPGRFISDLMDDCPQNGIEGWKKCLYHNVMLLAKEQDALLIDFDILNPEPQHIESINGGKLFKSKYSENEEYISKIYVAMGNGQYWIVGIEQTKGTKTKLWPKSTMKIMDNLQKKEIQHEKE